MPQLIVQILKSELLKNWYSFTYLNTHLLCEIYTYWKTHKFCVKEMYAFSIDYKLNSSF